MKKCKKCNEIKDLISFYKNKQSKDGFRSDCKDCVKNRASIWALENKENRKEYLKKYLIKNKDSIKEKRKDYLKQWNLDNKKYYSEYRVNERKNNPLLKIKHNLRNRTNLAFKCKYWKKEKGTEFLLGNNFDFVKNYLQSLFKDGMNWDNYGLWHIDHIKPLNLAKNKEEMIALCHYTNLQPLWAKDNLSKGAKF